MTFIFSNNPIDKIICWWYNKQEEISHKKWNKKHYYVECAICYKKLKSKDYPYSPEECGWRKLNKQAGWVCHQCLCHRDFRPFIKDIDEYERRYWEEYEKINEGKYDD